MEKWKLVTRLPYLRDIRAPGIVVVASIEITRSVVIMYSNSAPVAEKDPRIFESPIRGRKERCW